MLITLAHHLWGNCGFRLHKCSAASRTSAVQPFVGTLTALEEAGMGPAIDNRSSVPPKTGRDVCMFSVLIDSSEFRYIRSRGVVQLQ